MQNISLVYHLAEDQFIPVCITYFPFVSTLSYLLAISYSSPQNSTNVTHVKTSTNPPLTDNALSISQVRSTYNIPNCKFDTVDYTPAFVQIASGVWLVLSFLHIHLLNFKTRLLMKFFSIFRNMGPPQTVRSVSCPA